MPGCSDLARRGLRELLVLADDDLAVVRLDLARAALADQVLGLGLLR